MSAPWFDTSLPLPERIERMADAIESGTAELPTAALTPDLTVVIAAAYKLISERASARLRESEAMLAEHNFALRRLTQALEAVAGAESLTAAHVVARVALTSTQGNEPKGAFGTANDPDGAEAQERTR